MSSVGFSETLIDQIKLKKSYICVGLDPNFEGEHVIPEFVLKEANGNYNDAILAFNKQIIDATYKITPIYKPQFAFYEQYEAYDALKKTVDYAHKRKCLVIADAKRNDIGSTSKAYATAILGNMNADAVTINGYLGSDCIESFLSFKQKGVFVLVKTSNKSSAEFQDQYMVSGMFMNALNGYIERDKSANFLDILKQLNEKKGLVKSGDMEYFIPNYIAMARLVKNWSDSKKPASKTKYPYTNVGAVVGATFPDQLKLIRKEIPNSIILIPGYGTQGGSAKDIVYGFNEDGQGAIVNSSRGILYAYRSEIQGKRFKETEYMEAASISAEEMRVEINKVIENK
jgi:orotidine-5'-phosphate decarboxylase